MRYIAKHSLVDRVLKGPEGAYRQRLNVLGQQFLDGPPGHFLSKGHQYLAPIVHPLVYLAYQPSVDKGVRTLSQPVVSPLLGREPGGHGHHPSNPESIAEPTGSDETGANAAALQQCIHRHRAAMSKPVQRGQEFGQAYTCRLGSQSYCLQNASGDIRCGGSLVDADVATRTSHANVGEGSADIYSNVVAHFP